jgi:hypothetical protein
VAGIAVCVTASHLVAVVAGIVVISMTVAGMGVRHWVMAKLLLEHGTRYRRWIVNAATIECIVCTAGVWWL